jgi:hypothetical protein
VTDEGIPEQADGDGAVPQPDENHPASYADSNEGVGDVTGGSARALARLLTATPFLDLCDRAKGGTYLKAICITLDMVVRAVVLSLLLGILGAVAWKTLAPLPHIP